MPGWKRTAKRYAKKGVKALKKRYFKGGKVKAKNVKLVQIAKDVSVLKSMVNAEKKRIDEPNELAYEVAQIGTGLNSSGFMVKRNLFEVPTGLGHREKNGNSIKAHSYHIDFRARAMNTVQSLRLKVMLVLAKEPQNLTTSDDIISKLLKPSAFNDKYDILSPRNYENMNDFRIIASKNIYLKADTEPNQTDSRIFSMGGTLGFHQRTKEVAGAYTNYDTNELILVALAERGDINAPQYDFVRLEFTGTLYFYDN